MRKAKIIESGYTLEVRIGSEKEQLIFDISLIFFLTS